MEIVVIIVLLGVAAWIIGGISNAQPLNKWSIEKLERMHGKYLRHASSLMGEVTFDVDKIEKHKEAVAKADAIKAEIDRRKAASKE